MIDILRLEGVCVLGIRASPKICIWTVGLLDTLQDRTLTLPLPNANKVKVSGIAFQSRGT